MRILVVIPHYFGANLPEDNRPTLGSSIEPLGRIAALNETIVALYCHFGPNRHVREDAAIAAAATGPERRLDIIVVTMREHNLLAELGLAPGTFEVEYFDGKPLWMGFHAQKMLRERLGSYEFYCLLEDDLIIHDPAFFDKLAWFQNAFGPKALLAPARYEMSSTGTPAKVMIDPALPQSLTVPFRRPGQREEIEATWNGRVQVFHLPSNPHAGSFFLTQEQLAYWIEQPTFNDQDDSWVGPLESAGTLSVGKVFDLYKALRPDPFFLEIQHFGTRYASQNPPARRRYGEPPLLAIAQNALSELLNAGGQRLDAERADSSFKRQVKRWLTHGTAVELRARLDQSERQAHLAESKLRKYEQDTRSVWWLFRALGKALKNRVPSRRTGPGGAAR